MPASTVMHLLTAAAACALIAAMVCAFPLIWADLRRDLDRRVAEDAGPPPPARPFDHELDAMLDDDERIELLARRTRGVS